MKITSRVKSIVIASALLFKIIHLKIKLKYTSMKYFLNSTLALTILLVSCKKDSAVENTNRTRTNIVPFTQVGNQMKLQQQTTATDAASFKTTGNNTGLNPAHGQAGHRCELPVGAPLNDNPKPSQTTAPIATTAVTNTTAPTAANPPVANSTTPIPEGMNPAHGQTNHRCDIAVGAPLPI
jgi:hypothetical protein